VIPPEFVLWDVIEEHLDECAFEFARWSDVLRSPRYVLDEVARGPEHYLLGHLRAAAAASSAGFERLLAPVLRAHAEVEPALLTVAALLALVLERRQELETPLFDGEAPARRALVRACGLAGPELDDDWIRTCHASAGDARRRVVALELGDARRFPLPGLLQSLRRADADELLAAVSAARWSTDAELIPHVEALLQHDDPRVCRAAVQTGLHRGSGRALERCRELAADRESCHADVLVWLGLFAGPESHSLLEHALAWDEHRAAALRALGLSGNVAIVDRLVALVAGDDERTARLAGEAVCWIAGMDLREESLHRATSEASESEDAERALPPLDADDLDGTIEPADDSQLPLLDAERLDEAWQTRKAGLAVNRKHVAGDSDLRAAYAHLLEVGTMRDRASAAAALAGRTRGQIAIDTAAFTAEQRWHTAALVSGRTIPSSAFVEGW
jgi:uncharacterized protein (TIGR02270 family)